MIFVFWNVFLFVLCGYDKYCSMHNKNRISEKLFLFLSICGGCFGFYVGMILFHHKTRKKKFCFWIPAFCLIWTFLFFIM